MKEYLKFFQDKSLLSALLILLLIEGSFQLGCYKKFLKKNSYASNVTRITEHALSKKNLLDPDILIVGTSLAYEGISLRLLNEHLAPLNLKAQTIAIPGSELIVQQLALEKALNEFKNVKYIVHVNEPAMPWTVAYEVSLPTLAMVNSLNRIRAITKFQEHEYKLSPGEISYILFRLWAYRHDLADFILSPYKRLRDIKKVASSNENLYVYENTNQESLELYSFQNLEEALAVTQNNSPIPAGSNEHHREAIYKTCLIAKDTDITLEETLPTRIFKNRISNFYSEIKTKNIKIINVFPPISNYVTHFKHNERIEFWKKNFEVMAGNKIINLTSSLPQENNASYFYDAVHPNQKGMYIFTEKLADALVRYLGEVAK